MRRRTLYILAVPIFLAGCDAGDPSSPEAMAAARLDAPAAAVVGATAPLDAINAALAADAAPYRVAFAEIILHADEAANGPASQVIYAKDVGNKQLAYHFVPGDPRRGGGTDITYLVDTTEGATASGLTEAQTTGAIAAAMGTWASQTCSQLEIPGALAPVDLGIVQWILGFGGVPAVYADLTHAGWLPNDFFLALDPESGGSIIAVTLTFQFIDGAGDPTDIDNDHRLDAAFREIYYNDKWFWGIDVDIPYVDVETIALHEAGHGLSQGHFGTVAVHHRQGVKIQPEAVMNAIYFGQKQALLGTDSGGHCSIWGSWPG